MKTLSHILPYCECPHGPQTAMPSDLQALAMLSPPPEHDHRLPMNSTSLPGRALSTLWISAQTSFPYLQLSTLGHKPLSKCPDHRGLSGLWLLSCPYNSDATRKAPGPVPDTK